MAPRHPRVGGISFAPTPSRRDDRLVAGGPPSPNTPTTEQAAEGSGLLSELQLSLRTECAYPPSEQGHSPLSQPEHLSAPCPNGTPYTSPEQRSGSPTTRTPRVLKERPIPARSTAPGASQTRNHPHPSPVPKVTQASCLCPLNPKSLSPSPNTPTSKQAAKGSGLLSELQLSLRTECAYKRGDRGAPYSPLFSPPPLRPVSQRDTVYQPRATLWAPPTPTPAF
jgi:hypothetical protein